MTKGMMIGLGGLAVSGVLLLAIIGSVIGFNNTSIEMENGIKAQYSQNKNNYDNYFKKLKEAAQVPDMYTADMKKMWDGVMSKRYGANGSKALFSWIQEHNPTIDSSLYRKIQDIVESGRNAFESDQKMLLDKKREYDNYRMTFPNSLMASALHFPKIKLEDYNIVTSEETESIFSTKKSEPIKIR